LPHIVVQNLDFDILKKEGNNVGFSFITEPLQKEILIGTHINGSEFLLKVDITPKGFLIKQDKRVRVPSSGSVKTALKKIIEFLEPTVLFDNTANITPKQKALKNYIEPQAINEIAKDAKKVSLEIGFGSGRHILKNAAQNPDTLYFGIEIHTPSVMQALRQIELQKLENLYILSLDARVLLEVLPSNFLDELFIHFPIPWDSSPSKRVLTKESVANIGRVLKKDGILHIRTDSDTFFEHSKQVLEDSTLFRLEYKANQDISIISKYEQRWREKEKNIYDIYAVSKEESDALQELEFPTLNYDKIKNNIKPFTKKEGEVFVVLKNIYEIDNDKSLFFITGGSIHSPVKYFLLIQKEASRFFGVKPLPSRANIEAFKILKKALGA